LTRSIALAPHGPSAVNARELKGLATEARDAVKDHREERSGHFIIRAPAVDAVLLPYAREALESTYKALHEDLGFDASCPCASSSIAARPTSRPSRRCPRPRWRARARSRSASGRASW
jgi:hypothetical protein